MSEKKQVAAVAIDGPAGSGKSTIAKEVANRLQFVYIDTGAMYRAVALEASRQGVDLEDPAAMSDIAAGVDINFDSSGTCIMLNGEDVSAEIRTPRITAITKYAARVGAVRELLVAKQQQMSEQRPVVMEGRDITTVVLPAARWRIFLTASAEERARRRRDDFISRGHDVDYDELLQEIIARDKSDNEVGPMKKAQELARSGKGIFLLDTTKLNISEVIDKIVAYVRNNN